MELVENCSGKMNTSNMYIVIKELLDTLKSYKDVVYKEVSKK